MKARSKAAKRAGRKLKPAPVTLAHVAFIEVDNPLHMKDHDESATNPKRITASFNMRESYVGYLRQKEMITAAEKRAADRVRAAVECLAGANMALDYGREPVDGGGPREPLTERQYQAGKTLKEVSDRLGMQGSAVVVSMCAHNEWPKDLPHEKLRDYRSLRLRECLEELAVMWGWQTRRFISYVRTG
jgi:hypothetical protein